MNARFIGLSAKLGTSVIEVKGLWTAPFSLDVCVSVPEVPQAISELGDEALLQYFTVIKRLRTSVKDSAGMQKPAIGVLWAPTDESLYVKGDVPKAPKNDPALVLDIPGKERNYRHIVAAWNIGEERPFKNWLAEYTE